MRNPKYGAPRAKPAVPFLTPTWGDIPATRWRIPPRPKAVVSCCRDEYQNLKQIQNPNVQRRQLIIKKVLTLLLH